MISVAIRIFIAIMITMMTVQMTLDEDLVIDVDAAAAKAGTTRSAFAREALRQAVARVREAELEQKHRDGYKRKPASADEFGAWASQQAWGEP